MSKLTVQVQITDLPIWEQTVSLLKEISDTTKDPETKQRITEFVDSLGDEYGNQ